MWPGSGSPWSLDLDEEHASLQATPLAIDGVVYFTGFMSQIYAVDARSGNLLWKHDPEMWKHEDRTRIFFPTNRGPAYDNGRIFSATLDGRLLALDAKTGKLLWSAETLKPGTPQTITGAPRTFAGKVIIGNGGSRTRCARLCHRLRPKDRQAALALLHGSRQSRGEPGRSGDGSCREDLER